MQIGDLVISKINGDIGLIVATKLWKWEHLGNQNRSVTTLIVMTNSNIQEWLVQNTAVLIHKGILTYK